jgi:sterol desaturase/sphingolipid hydroxylase (fatty acid hydroxylase superfamily)
MKEVSENQDTVKAKGAIRLFKSDLLEFFTHIHPAVVLLIYLPVILYLLYLSPRQPLTFIFFLGGLLIWGPVEYLLHRFLFHFKPKTARQRRISFLFHGVHHAQPMVKTRLVMPPAVSIPLASLFFLLFRLASSVLSGNPDWAFPLFAGFLYGYLSYDMLHYSLHHLKMRGFYLKMVHKNHMRHHAVAPNRRFGVTTLVWDWIFRTSGDSGRP